MTMKVLVTGGNFLNQGAYLMLVAAGVGIRQHLGAQPVIPVRFGTQRQKAWIGYDTLLAEERVGFFPRLGRAVEGSWRDRLPFVTASEVDAVFDITGFAFGDQWADAPLMRRARNYEMWASRGIPIYMLPQAFGPFELTAKPAKRAVQSSRIVYARDVDSYEHVRNLVGEAEGVKIGTSPDFTIGVEGTLNAVPSHDSGFGVIVPNWNIMKRAASVAHASGYLNWLVEASLVMQQHGLSVVGLCHEGRRDREILDKIRSQVPAMEVLDGLNGQELKGVLGAASVVVSGRYHALVSALSQGVPSILHGWSHKYRWLAEDFDCKEFVADPYSPGEIVGDLIARAVDSESPRERIVIATDKLKARNLAMWSEIASDLGWRSQTGTVLGGIGG
ncbi:MAG: polysaccharide pyruvyl transferase family protein [Acidobacteria bacterium]|nr:MAG: polysaccharide pyruvyl transferase family protein [Acidobacteriota bacterium]